MLNTTIDQFVARIFKTNFSFLLETIELKALRTLSNVVTLLTLNPKPLGVQVDHSTLP